MGEREERCKGGVGEVVSAWSLALFIARRRRAVRYRCLHPSALEIGLQVVEKEGSVCEPWIDPIWIIRDQRLHR